MFFRLFFSAILFFSVQNSFAKQEISEVVAKVNNRVITNFDLKDRYNFLLNFSQIKVNSAEEKNILLNQIVYKMIDEELIRQEGEALGIEVLDSEINAVIEAQSSKKGKSFSTFKAEFSQKNISFENYQKQVKADLLWSKIVSGSLRSKIKITDLEIKEFLEQQKLDTDISKYRISEIFIPAKNDAKILAEKLYEELKNGANFEEFVKQFSQSPTSESGGEIGWVSKSDINQEIYKAISNIAKKSYSKPVFLSDGYYIFKLLDKKTVTEIKENDLNFARNRIFTKELTTEGRAYLMEIHKKSFIEVSRGKIKNV